MKILVIGSGGREHAMAWRLTKSEKVSRVFVAPGNAGTECEEGIQNVPLTQVEDLIRFAQDEGVSFTVVGPEAPLSEGIADHFNMQV